LIRRKSRKKIKTNKGKMKKMKRMKKMKEMKKQSEGLWRRFTSGYHDYALSGLSICRAFVPQGVALRY
jgi:hypothetical protein